MPQDDKEHWSDCAIYNAPAYEPGPCDCGGYSPEKDGVSVAPIPKVKIARNLTDLLDEQHRERTAMTFIERIEAATGPSRDLDVAIFRIVKPEYASPLFKLYGTGMRHVNDSSDARCMPEPKATVPYYTASIDAALTLVPEGMRDEIEITTLYQVARVVINLNHGPDDGPYYGENNCNSIPLALAAAAIRAKGIDDV